MAEISFIIPCYNSEDFMSPCLESLSRQTLTDVEFIFVDDGSTDGTREIIENFMRKEPRAKLVVQENKGLKDARLTGLRNATAKFVAFLDSDDFIDITAAEEALGIFESDSAIDAVLYTFSYVKNGVVSEFNYSTIFPLSGMDVLRNTIPSWRISTMGIYRREHAWKAYCSVTFCAINSDEVATRLIFESCRSVSKMKSQYFYVQRNNSISKKPSIKYITRLESASWLRDYSVSKVTNNVSRKDAETHFINELCEIIFKFRSAKKLMEPEANIDWVRGISRHRKRVLRNFISYAISYPRLCFSDIKLLKKTIFIIVWPALNF